MPFKLTIVPCLRSVFYYRKLLIATKKCNVNTKYDMNKALFEANFLNYYLGQL